MHRLGLGILVLIALAFGSATLARADTPAGGCDPPGPSAIVCYGTTPCPGGYVDPVGANFRAQAGSAGGNIMVSQNAQKWLCQKVVPDTQSSSSSSSANGAVNVNLTTTAPTAASPTTSSTASTTNTSSATTTTVAPVLAAVTTTVAVDTKSGLGSYLSSPTHMTLYVLSTDSAGVSTCTGACAVIWLPLQPSGDTLSQPISATELLDVITRDDGLQQVTYNGMPLYTYTGDLKPGDTTGQGLAGIWQVATP